MSTRASRTARIDAEAQSGLVPGISEDGDPSVGDIASNNRENSTARVVRRFYASVVPTGEERLGVARQGTAGRDVVLNATDDRLEERMLLRAPVLPERRSVRVASYFALQEWEGYVTGISSETFTADLVDMTRFSQQPNEQVELPLEEVGHEQRGELRVGNIFRWTIGYETLPSGQRRRVSQLVFRQLPRWARVDIDAANKLGDDRYRQIKWE